MTTRRNKSAANTTSVQREDNNNNDIEDADRSLLSFLSFSATDGPTSFPFPGLTSNNMNDRRRLQWPSASMQGVLWKRRDIFRNRWRPRWFVLHPEQGILTYYLLNGNSQPSSTSYHNSTWQPSNNRQRADSDISMDTIDYEVVPRGSIFLRNPSCTVEANEALTIPEERLYALTISDRESGKHCHLASRSSTRRDQWLEKIQDAITEHQVLTSQESTFHSNEGSQIGEPAELPASTVPNEIDEVLSQQESLEEAPEAPWATLPFTDLTTGVPAAIVAKIDSVLATHLPYVTEQKHAEFKSAHEDAGVNVSHHKTRSLVRSTYEVPDHHPIEYLQLAWDFSLLSELEPNIEKQETLRVLNKNTSIIYTAYHPVWPTKAREFCYLAHWRLVRNNSTDEIALCLVAFSSPEANDLKAVDRDHVRGTLNVSLHFWRPRNDGGCTHTRVLSFDMNGSIPEQLMQSILQQQATFPPRAMDLQLQKIKSDQQGKEYLSKFRQSEMNYDFMFGAIANIRPHQKRSLRQVQSMEVSSSTTQETGAIESPWTVSIGIESLVLALPLLIHVLFKYIEVPWIEVIAMGAAIVCCIRWVVLQHLLCHSQILPSAKYTNSINASSCSTTTTICQVSMDIRTALSFLENEKKFQVALGDDKQIALELRHVLLRCIFKTMQRYPSLLVRSLPLLPLLYILDMEWYDGSLKEKPLWFPPNQQHSIQAIVSYEARAKSEVSIQPNAWLISCLLGPSCQLWTTEVDSFSQEMSTMTCKAVEFRNNCPISVVLHSVDRITRMEGNESRKNDSGNRLELSFCFQNSNRKLCESFVKEVEKLLQFPELCDT